MKLIDRFDAFEMDYLKLARRIVPGKDKLRPNVLKLLEHAQDRTRLYPASTKYHHCWPGGLADHITQVMWLMLQQRDAIPGTPLWQIPVLAYLHDWEKHWKYEPLDPDSKELPKELKGAPATAVAALAVRPAFRYVEIPGKYNPSTEISVGVLLERFGLPVDREMSNALMLSEGGWSPQAKNASLDKLATVLHAADMISSHCYQDVGGAGSAHWAHKTYHEVLQAHYRAKPLGVGTWPR